MQKEDPDRYSSPLASRWQSKEMSALFSPRRRYGTWRKLWIALAESQKELGLPITDEQVKEMKLCCDRINFDVVAEEERKRRHDVMAHIHAFAVECPMARPIIHLGATSAFVTDNTDVILMREGLEILKRRLVNVVDALAAFAKKYADTSCLAYTHLQPAQLTTVGKRATIWMQDLLLDLGEIERRIEGMPFLGAKGTTGTQDSFLKLFDGDAKKVEALDEMIARKMGFEKRWPVTGQTYPRKLDWLVLSTLSGIAQSAHKFAEDIRLLQGFGELQEPFEKMQAGSSAMPYKQNPMRCERVCSLAKHVINLAQDAASVASTQWLERSLDDSANRRISLPESFIAADVILDTCLNVAQGLVVVEDMIRRRIDEHLPFIAAEEIMMSAVKEGGDRQTLHEAIRKHSLAALEKIRGGGENDFIARIAGDELFASVKGALGAMLNPANFIGLAPQQTKNFLALHVKPVLEKNKSLLGLKSELQV